MSIINILSILIFQLNVERQTLRRPAMIITSLVPDSIETKFNFNKVKSEEILFEVIDRSSEHSNECFISFLINNSPLTKYHSLICPNVRKNWPQVLTLDAIKCAANVMFGFNDRNYRILYNSPGAFASVNHLHLHLLYVERTLSIQRFVSFILITKETYTYSQ